MKAALGQALQYRFVRFLLAGGLAALCNFGSRFVYSLWVDFSTAVIMAFFTGLGIGFVLHKSYVFTTSRNSMPIEVLWFIFINFLALAQTWGLSIYLVEHLPTLGSSGLGSREWIEASAHLAGVLLPVFTSYMGHRYLTFRE